MKFSLSRLSCHAGDHDQAPCMLLSAGRCPPPRTACTACSAGARGRRSPASQPLCAIASSPAPPLHMPQRAGPHACTPSHTACAAGPCRRRRAGGRWRLRRRRQGRGWGRPHERHVHDQLRAARHRHRMAAQQRQALRRAEFQQRKMCGVLRSLQFGLHRRWRRGGGRQRGACWRGRASCLWWAHVGDLDGDGQAI